MSRAAPLTGSAAEADRGLYITVEGVDGCGKSTLVDGLRTWLPDAVFTREPYDELWTGEAVREALGRDTGPFTDALLFMADRAEHLHKVVEPALEDGRTVVSDRSADSTYAYQADRVPVVDAFEWFDACYAPWDRDPDLTLWLDMPAREALERSERLEKYEDVETVRRAAAGYQRLAERHPARYHRIDATQPRGAVLAEAVEVIAGWSR